MPAQGDYDAEATSRQLETWLAGRIDGATEVTISGLDAPAATGHSSETMLFDASWTAGGADHSASLVLRTAPEGHAVFLDYDLGLQYAVIDAVARNSSVPVPPLRWMEPDPSVIGRSFLVMDRVDGLVPPDRLPYTMEGWLLGADPADQARLQKSGYEVLADIHAIDWRAAGLDRLDQERYGRIGLEQQLGHYREFLEIGREGEPQPALADALNWLSHNRPSPEPEPVLLWGDARIGNVIYSDFEPAAVLDWEMATLGPREVDVAWMHLFERFFSEFLGVDNLPGFVPVEESVAAYEARSGVRVSDLEWYTIFGAFRYAVIMMRVIKATLASGEDPGFTTQDNVALSMMVDLLERAR